jgi:hypothetical protein
LPRIRTVKPDLFGHDDLYDAEKRSGLPLRLAFIGLFTVADREGRFKWRPREMKRHVLPYDDLDFKDVLTALYEARFIGRYEVDGALYGFIPTWALHQTINTREAQSALPPPPADWANTCMHMHAHAMHGSALVTHLPEHVHTPDSDEVSTHEPSPTKPAEAAPIKEAEPIDGGMHVHAHAMHMHAQGEGKGKEGKEVNLKPKTKPMSISRVAEVTEVFDCWRECMNSSRSKLDDKRAKLIATALGMGYTNADLCKAIRGCSRSAWHMGANDRKRPYNGLNLILRDGEHIDSFIAMDDAPPLAHATPPPSTRPSLMAERTRTIQALTGRSKPNDANTFDA